MLQKICLILFISCLSLSGCAHGPKIGVCISDADSGFDCSYKKKSYYVNFLDSINYSAYDPISYQNVLNYCAARDQDGVQLPNFIACKSNPSQGGFSCAPYKCSFNAKLNGVSCAPTNSFNLPFKDSANYVAVSETDNNTVMAYCNIKLME